MSQAQIEGTAPEPASARPLPPAIEEDAERVALVASKGFQGPHYEQLAADLYKYAYPRLLKKIRTSEVVALTLKSKTPICVSDEDRITLNRSQHDRDELAVYTIDKALRQFTAELKKGAYQPQDHVGRNGRPASLSSFFFGMCLLVYPRVYAVWQRERTDQFLAEADKMSNDALARAFGHAAEDPVPADVAKACAAIARMLDRAKPRMAAVMRLTIEGYNQSEIADQLNLVVGDVENDRYRFRQKVKKAVRFDGLPVPAQWRASKLLAEKAPQR
jgi:hypothetical protein